MKKSRDTVTVVPRRRAASSTRPRVPPAARTTWCRAVGRRGLEIERGHRGDRRQRLAAEAEAAHAHEIAGRADLGRGVALEREQRVVALHAAAVVGSRG